MGHNPGMGAVLLADGLLTSSGGCGLLNGYLHCC